LHEGLVAGSTLVAIRVQDAVRRQTTRADRGEVLVVTLGLTATLHLPQFNLLEQLFVENVVLEGFVGLT